MLRILLFICFLFLVPSIGLTADEPFDAMQKALAEKDVGTVTRLLNRGMSPDTADPEGTTLLMFAAREGDARMVDALLKARANPKLRNRVGDTPLMLAAVQGHLPIVRALLKAGGNVGPGEGAWTPLHYAA